MSSINNSVDRLIRSRRDLSTMMIQVSSKNEKEDLIGSNDDLEHKGYFNHGLDAYKKRNYRQNLAQSLGLPIPKRTNFQDLEENWPVKPRKKPVMKDPIAIRKVIDAMNLEFCDLNQNNIMAVINSRHTLVYWNLLSWECCPEESTTIYIETLLSRRIKFNLTGNLLAIAKKNGGVLINNKNESETITLKEITLSSKITSFEWSKNDVLYAGCSDGKIFEYHISNSLSDMTQIYIAEKARILSIKLSCKQNYLATSSIDKYFTVYSTYKFKVLLRTKMSLPIKCLAWHPWRECLIATQSDEQNGTLKLWNVCKPKDAIEHKLDETNSKCIDYLTFNKLTGELVMSYFDTINERCYIKVLSSFQNSTEHIEWKVGRISTLLWSGDNKVLFVGSAGNAYSVWNFCEESSNSRYYLR